MHLNCLDDTLKSTDCWASPPQCLIQVDFGEGSENMHFFILFYMFLFFFNYLFIIYLLFLFLAVLGLRFCARAFSNCGKWGPLFIAACGPLTITASLVAEQRLQTLRLSSCGSRAQLLRGMWDLPRPGLEPVSPALAGRLSTTAPPGKPQICISNVFPSNSDATGLGDHSLRIPELEKKKSGGKASRKKTK